MPGLRALGHALAAASARPTLTAGVVASVLLHAAATGAILLWPAATPREAPPTVAIDVVFAPATVPAPPLLALALPDLPPPGAPGPSPTEPPAAETGSAPNAAPLPRAKPHRPRAAAKSPLPPAPAETAPATESIAVGVPTAAPALSAGPAESVSTPAIESSAPTPPTVAAITSVGPLTGGAALPPDRGAVPLGGSVNAPPRYPYLARARAEEGQVVVRVEVNAAGGVRAIAIARSSGFALLDEAALGAVRQWRFEPARRSGAAVAATLDVPISFRLTDR